jgi:methyltransferase (TIGR00027 family)
MKKTQTSITAMGIAAMRALESEKPAGIRICYDPFARQFVIPIFYYLTKIFSGYGEKRAPGTQGYIVCRCRYFDDYLQSCLDSRVEQVVLLGAGLASQAYRSAPASTRVRFFEVDHPASQASKFEQLNKIFGKIPTEVAYVPIDFNVDTLDKLYDHGYRRDARTVFLWEGVTYYLSSEGVEATLAWVKLNSAPGSSIIFDYIYTSALTTNQKTGEVKRMQLYSGITGEGLHFGIEKGGITVYLEARGYHQVVDADDIRLRELYCIGPNPGRTVSGNYAIVHAEV